MNKTSNLDKSAVDKYKEEIVSLFEKKIISPFCVDFENRLRMLAHSHLKVSTNQSKVREEMDDFMLLLRLDPIHFDGKGFHIKRM